MANTREEYFWTKGSKLAVFPFNTAAINSASVGSIAKLRQKDGARRIKKSKILLSCSEGWEGLGFAR